MLIQSYNTADYFSFFKHGTSEENRKLAAINRDNQEDHPGNNHARNTIFPRNHNDYFTQLSVDIGDRRTKNRPRVSVGGRAEF